MAIKLRTTSVNTKNHDETSRLRLHTIFMANFEDEIILRDPTGKFKILRGGRFYDWEPPKAKRIVPLPAKLVDQVLAKSGLKIKEDLKTRMAEILEAYQKDVRDKFETRNTLMREVESGGMGFTSEQADLVIEKIEEVTKREKGAKVKGVEKVEKEKEEAALVRKMVPKEAVLAVESPTSVAASVSTPKSVPKVLPSAMATAITSAPTVPSGVAEFVFSPADEAEILAHAQKLPQILTGLKPIEVTKFIDSIIRESGVDISEDKRKKLENILLTHLKDIRDGYETRAILLRAAEPEGLALSEEQTEKILAAARQKLKEFEDKLKEEEEERIRKTIEEERKKAEAVRQEAEEKVKEKINKRWSEITKRGVVPVAMPTELVSPPIGLRTKVLAITPPAPPSVLRAEEMVGQGKEREGAKEGNGPAESIRQKGDITSAPVTKITETSPLEAKKISAQVEEKPKPLEIFKPVVPPVVRRPIPQKNTRPRLDDVKYVPKLIGPVEELREMTLVDFRRLNSDPSVAAAKVKEKINLLEKESVTKKIAGIRAWQESEVSRLYLEISRESLTKGVPVNQVISLRASAGKPTLTADEYQAVMELNRALRY